MVISRKYTVRTFAQESQKEKKRAREIEKEDVAIQSMQSTVVTTIIPVFPGQQKRLLVFVRANFKPGTPRGLLLFSKSVNNRLHVLNKEKVEKCVVY